MGVREPGCDTGEEAAATEWGEDDVEIRIVVVVVAGNAAGSGTTLSETGLTVLELRFHF